jgi:D,D-heptose 1,7-bisphosphate phosphatase
MEKAVFLDKDGTLTEDIPYNIDTGKVRFTAHAIEALCVLKRLGYRIFIVTNQSGIASGYFGEPELRALFQYIADRLQRYGAKVDGFYFCPHAKPQHEEKDGMHFRCGCRKPGPGMLLQAATEHNISLSASWMIGDILDDIEAGRRAGCKTILLNNGNETVWRQGQFRFPHFIVDNLLTAAGIIERFHIDAEQSLKQYIQP